MDACAQPRCSGQIEDGYCNVCGLAAASRSPAGVAAVEPAPAEVVPRPGTTAGVVPANEAPSGARIEQRAAWGGAAGVGGSTRTGSARTPSTRSSAITRSGSTGSGRGTSRALAGARLLARAPLPAQDPLGALVPGFVPERKRRCSSCDAPVARQAGFCPACGQEYSFRPPLAPGDLVSGKYEIKGTIAFGGLGWIYLALDTVLNRWVVLKGLLNATDPQMVQVALEEREYLAALKHPNIVSIYDFVTHGTAGFIVMEYVNGKTLMALRKERGGPLPVAEAISYVLEVLPALQYIADEGLVYCDFKPENVMAESDTVKLVDLGAVRRADEVGGAIFGSRGYAAPEAHEAPSAASDLFSVGRALAVLVANFDFQGADAFTLPSPASCDVFAKNETLYRFLVKATRPEPAERFQSANEMAEQLLGVLRDVAGESADLGPVESAVFAPDSEHELEAASERLGDGLAHLKVRRDDPAAAVIAAAGAVPDADRRRAIFERAVATYPDSIELRLRLVDALVHVGEHDAAEERIAEMERGRTERADWRLAWYRARALLARGRARESLAAFRSVMDDLPGELAPRQALARAYEMSGEIEAAIRLYGAVARVDATFASAAVGLGRCLEKKGDTAAAAAAYRRVPSTSSRYVAAQIGLARALLRSLPRPTARDVVDAGEALASLGSVADGIAYRELRAHVFSAAAELAIGDGGGVPAAVLGVPFRRRPLQLAAEAELRACARFATDANARWQFVDRANAARPVTWT